MAGLWISQNLKALWQEHFRDVFSKSTGGTVIVASGEQKQAIKEWLVEDFGGSVGWNFFTRAQAQRRAAKIGRWELEVIAKTLLPKQLWPGVGPWSRDVISWVLAGYDAREIPFEEPWRRLTTDVLKKVSTSGEKLTAQIKLHADIVLGFDPLEVFDLEAKEWGLLVESEEVSPAQMVQIAALEKKTGAAVWCDMGERQEVPALCVDSERELIPALREMLLSHPQLKRVVWQGEAARAAVEGWYQKEFLPKNPWPAAELLKSYQKLQERPKSFSAFLEFSRCKTACGIFPAEKLQEIEKEAAQRWESTGLLSGSIAADENLALPDSATMEVFAQETLKILGPLVGAQELLERLAPLKIFFEGAKISKELWIDLLQPATEVAGYYGGVRLLPFDRAQGLVDDETLILWTSSPKSGGSSLILPERVREANARVFKEGQIPARGYVEADSQRSFNARKSAAQKTGAWVVLSCEDVWKEIKAKKRFYKTQAVSLSAHGLLTQKHIIRRDPQQKFGRYDFALPTPVKISCKMWESALMAPELLWYEALKLRPMWGGAQEDPQALWIGNWVHAALKAGIDPIQVNNFFSKNIGDDVQLVWREARAEAWRQALGFAFSLKEAQAKVLQAELPVSGAFDLQGTKIELRGRIDAVLELPGGERLIIDYKTSPSATVLSDKKLRTGDGLQLWLYGRLLTQKEPGTIGLCRWIFDKKLQAQLTLTSENIFAEERMKILAASGVLGQRGWVWGRFGGEDRLPMAALPMDWRIIFERRKESYGSAD